MTIIAAAALAVSVGLISCGGSPKTVPTADRAALDGFTDSARSWTRDGSTPWYAAFKSRDPERLAAVAPSAERAMAGSVGGMASAAQRIGDGSVRDQLGRIVSAYRLKLAAVREVDSASRAGSVAGVQRGIGQLQRAGSEQLAALKGYRAAAKRAWGSDPLSDFSFG